jgi:hypothetical protein
MIAHKICPKGAARLLLFAACLIFATFTRRALAQTAGSGVLTGTIVDAASKKPLVDVVVTATSPDLQAEQVVVTDSAGFYRIPALPTGVYTLRFDKDKYRPGARDRIALRADSTLRVNFELLPEEISGEEVVVQARPPIVDVGSSSVGTNITSDFVKRVPVAAPDGKGGASRSFEAVAEVTPGAKQDYNGSGMSFGGSSSPENNYVIDGLSVSNPGFGIIGTPLSTEFVKEINVVTGGYMPEYGRTMGGVLNVVTKSGSNDFHGGVFSYCTPGALQATPKNIVTSGGSVVANPAGLSFLADVGGDVGGPIFKDKLWFYAGFDVSDTVYNVDRYFTHQLLDASGTALQVGPDGNPLTEKIPGSDQHWIASAQSLQAIAKLTWAINQDNKLTGTFIAAPTWSGGNGRLAIDPVTGLPEGAAISRGTYTSVAHILNNSAYDASLKWSSEFANKRILVDTIAGWHHEEDVVIPADGSRPGSPTGTASIPSVDWINPHSITDFEPPNPALMAACTPSPAAINAGITTLCPSGSEYFSGGTSSSSTGRNSVDIFERFAVGSTVTVLFQGIGHHIVKAGFNVEGTSFDHTKSHSGLSNAIEGNNPLTNAPGVADTEAFGVLHGPDNPIFNEPWRVKPRSILAGGFIQDSWAVLDVVTLNAGVRYDAQQIFSADGRVGISLPNQWSPRVGLIYDPTQQGRAKIFASYARYYENMPLSIGEASLTGEGLLKAFHPALGPDGSFNGAACDIRVPPYCNNAAGRSIQVNNTPSQYWQHSGFGQDPVDPHIKPTSIDDFVVGFEYEIFKDARFGVSYQRRWVNAWIEDMSSDGRATFFIGNPGYGIATMFPKAERNYDAGTLHFTKAFSNDWLASASYTLSYLRGNIPGLDSLGANHGGSFDAPELSVNSYGPIGSDTTHAIKVFGAKDVELSRHDRISVGLSLRATSGTPTSYFGADIFYGPGNNYLIPAGSGRRLPWLYNSDANLGYKYSFDENKSITFGVDIFNLLNFQEVTSVDQDYTTQIAVGKQNGTLADVHVINGNVTRPLNLSDKNDNFGQPTSYQSPRIFRFSLRGTF